ncbi:MAG: hypothetical protein F2842_05790 [Actinobacteria bacterium]|uniref:Unannotated protein n=1 Tax=freshwater metagenome TaxID=449393 RepID=A0A6J7JR95_9ZZZZ|nr:hypothetical protein [Actinomycetota bacterium]
MNWHEVWTRKGLESPGPEVDPLEAALMLDGYGSVANSFLPVSSMPHFAARVLEILQPRDNDSVYEVGCGSGAFLGTIDRSRPGLQLGGCDYSSTLVEACHRYFPQITTEVREAIDIDPSPVAHHLLAFSVFHYFPDLEYAATVVGLMGAKASTSVSILDVPDLALRPESEAMRRGQLSEGEYDAHYAGLEHLYYERAWLAEQFPADEWAVSVEDQSVAGYLNTPFRFNVFARRQAAVTRQPPA